VAELLLPRTLLLPTVPPVQLQNANGPRGPVRPDYPLQTLLGVQIDASIELDRLAWAGLIDSTGALADPANGESASAFPLVVARVLAALPADEETLGQLLTSMGSMAPTTVTNEDASHLLAVIGAGLRTMPVKRDVLPVTYLRAGDAQAAVARQPDTDELMADLFPRALLQPGHPGPVRVVVERAGAGLGSATAARITLAEAGFGAVDGQPVLRSLTSSVVYVPDDAASTVQRGKDVAAALGLPPASVVVDGAEGPPSTCASCSAATSRPCERLTVLIACVQQASTTVGKPCDRKHRSRCRSDRRRRGCVRQAGRGHRRDRREREARHHRRLRALGGNEASGQGRGRRGGGAVARHGQ
jgi:hypothetical protein